MEFREKLCYSISAEEKVMEKDEIKIDFDTRLLNILKKRREHIKLSRDDVAKRLGIRTGLLVSWEGGAIPSSHYYLMRWMQVLGFDISTFMGPSKHICQIPVVDKIQWLKGKFYFKYQYTDENQDLMFNSYPLYIDRDIILLEDIMNIDAIIDSRNKERVLLGYRINPTEKFEEQADNFLDKFVYRLKPNLKDGEGIRFFDVVGINMKTHRLELASLQLTDGIYFQGNTYEVHLYKGNPEDKEIEERKEMEYQDDFDAYFDKMLEASTGDYDFFDELESIYYDHSGLEEVINPYFFRPLYLVLNSYVSIGNTAYRECLMDQLKDLNLTKERVCGTALDYVPFKQPKEQNPDEIPSNNLTAHVISFPNQR